MKGYFIKQSVLSSWTGIDKLKYDFDSEGNLTTIRTKKQPLVEMLYSPTGEMIKYSDIQGNWYDKEKCKYANPYGDNVCKTKVIDLISTANWSCKFIIQSDTKNKAILNEMKQGSEQLIILLLNDIGIIYKKTGFTVEDIQPRDYRSEESDYVYFGMPF